MKIRGFSVLNGSNFNNYYSNYLPNIIRPRKTFNF
jgi:hypothetical protein